MLIEPCPEMITDNETGKSGWNYSAEVHAGTLIALSQYADLIKWILQTNLVSNVLHD